MPLYEYKCPNCNHIVEDFKPANEAKYLPVCPKCNTLMVRQFDFHAGNKEYDSTFYSDSLAINPNQIEEHKKHFPNIRVDKQGRVGFDSYKQHDDYLKKTGFVKHPQKTKPKGVKI